MYARVARGRMHMRMHDYNPIAQTKRIPLSGPHTGQRYATIRQGYSRSRTLLLSAQKAKVSLSR